MENEEDCCCEFVSFIKTNEDFLNNPVIKGFLSKKDNYRLFKQSICHPTQQNQELLDQAFQAFYFYVRFTAYAIKETNVEIRWSKHSADTLPSGYIKQVQSFPLENDFYIENIALENSPTDSNTQIMGTCSTCKAICNNLQGMSCSLVGAAACTVVCAAIAGPACVLICGALWYVKCVLDNKLICGTTCKNLGYC
ncbi:hypothetical protein [Peribacillus butanolivorans]